MPTYPKEDLSKRGLDDGQMQASADNLEAAVVGHRIIRVETIPDRWGRASTNLTLDNGHVVKVVDTSDCCAYTELQEFLLHPELVDHIITGVGTTDGFTKWHVYADMGDVLELTVGWSCGNPFYYGYGFEIAVEPVDAHQS